MSIRDRLPPPPSSVTGPLYDWMASVVRTINNMPTLSYFSGQTPNSAVTGFAGDLAINIGSASTVTRAWINTASTATAGQTGWVTLATGPA